MPKTASTPRNELVCGKLDKLEDELRRLGHVELLELASAIRHDCERMEAQLIRRKDEVADLQRQDGGAAIAAQTWKFTVCARTGQLSTREACLACHAARLQPTCEFNPTTPRYPTGPACCICGQPSDWGRFSEDVPAPMCFDCYIAGDPAQVTATAIAWCNTHGGHR